MQSGFVELNLYIYHSSRGAMLDVVIWCLGPYVDSCRSYSFPRVLLAELTRLICRGYLSLQRSQ
ncbi:MAG: hypothetical protein OEV00_00475 [Acidobacteriota bacterium]|nr:hypothetical protein [Acidobacteriota bacterium]MDH3783778.1 hypothetical protein [Acidobacteriota bacterium]